MSFFCGSDWKKIHFDTVSAARTPALIQILDGSTLRVLIQGGKNKPKRKRDRKIKGGCHVSDRKRPAPV